MNKGERKQSQALAVAEKQTFCNNVMNNILNLIRDQSMFMYVDQPAWQVTWCPS